MSAEKEKYEIESEHRSLKKSTTGNCFNNIVVSELSKSFSNFNENILDMELGSYGVIDFLIKLENRFYKLKFHKGNSIGITPSNHPFQENSIYNNHLTYNDNNKSPSKMMINEPVSFFNIYKPEVIINVVLSYNTDKNGKYNYYMVVPHGNNPPYITASIISSNDKTKDLSKGNYEKEMDSYLPNLSIHNKIIDIKRILNDDDEFIELNTDFNFINRTKTMSPKDAANYLRDIWKLPKGPILHIINLLENKGIFIDIKDEDLYDLNINNFSGLTIESEGIFFICINGNQPIDRQRFTIAHELGHIVLDHFSKKEFIYSNLIEKEANEFASEFLMPSDEIKSSFTKFITLSGFENLKKYWKVSIASLIKKANDLEKITPEKYKSLFIQLSQKGWRKIEPPLDYHYEEPFLFNKIIDYYRNELKFSDKDFFNYFKYQGVLPSYIDSNQRKIIKFKSIKNLNKGGKYEK